MTPEQALKEARTDQLRPLYLVAGEEAYLVAEVVAELRRAALAGSPLGLNEDQLDAADVDIDTALATARTLPMMAKRRFVLLRGIERWETAGSAEEGASSRSDDKRSQGGKGEKGAKSGPSESPWDKLVAYAEQPNDKTTLVLMAPKLDKRRRLVLSAIKGGWFVPCEPLSRAQLPGWIRDRAGARGYKLAPGLDDMLAELAGPELSFVNDALERVGLYAGLGNTITENDAAECLVKVRPTTVWELVGAVGRRDVGQALKYLAEVYDPQDRGLRLVGVLAWAARQLLRFESALRSGASPADAAKAAGAPPFKARQLAEEVKRMPQKDIERWLETLADVDLALKGGSRLPARAVLETAILKLCAPPS